MRPIREAKALTKAKRPRKPQSPAGMKPGVLQLFSWTRLVFDLVGVKQRRPAAKLKSLGDITRRPTDASGRHGKGWP